MIKTNVQVRMRYPRPCWPRGCSQETDRARNQVKRGMCECSGTMRGCYNNARGTERRLLEQHTGRRLN